MLEIRAADGYATEISHCAALITERVNAVHGYCAVDEIRVVQTGEFSPVVPSPPPSPLPPPTAGEVAEVEMMLGDISDPETSNPELHKALRGLGIALKVSQRADKKQQRSP